MQWSPNVSASALTKPRRAADLEDQGGDVLEEEPTLADRGVAGTGAAPAEAKRDFGDGGRRGADQNLEKDLEADRPELESLDRGLAAEEVAGEGIGGLARLPEEDLGQPPAEAGDRPPGRSTEPEGAPAAEAEGSAES